MKAIIEVDIPEFQIGQEVNIYFPDSMCVKGIAKDPKSGHWDIEFEPRKNEDEWDRLVCKCSECGNVLVKQMYNKDTMDYDECVADFRQDITFRHAYYCKHCGAKMEGE